MRNDCQDNRFFKMGAAVAVSELYGLGRLGRDGSEATGFARSFLESFGIEGMDDVDEIGITGPYSEDLSKIYGCSS